ncbi:hypothetical protein FOA43_003475 [Brettanomyces nanus]|uniref:Uncharacterized protein n=1 Tax=Eeniella nana TaxID=13502 RepID=A0A875S8U2_EENNA|nr:uncharacterized protein FOA43_003475 [Brettanomyces nanus]QPG76089.1 hypothetical protein FOA43_003475 [Brettanomyces nanus]
MNDHRIPSQYRELLHEAFENGTVPPVSARPLKKRRRHRSESPTTDDISDDADKLGKGVESREHCISSALNKGSSNITAIVLSSDEDTVGDAYRDLKKKESKIGPETEAKVEIDIDDDSDEEDGDEDEDEDFDSDDFEDVDLEHVPTPDLQLHDYEEDSKQIKIPLKTNKILAQKRKKKTVVPREERMFRKDLHMMYIFTMVAHGVARNSWCSDRNLLNSLKRDVPARILDEYATYLQHRKKTNVTTASKTRKLLDLLKDLMVYWYTSWTIDKNAPVIYKKGWDELDVHIPRQRMSKKKFSESVEQRSGSRDIAAQGFISLLRSIGIQARLVFSLQPPDFTNLSQLSSIAEKHEADERRKTEQMTLPMGRRKSRRALTQHDRLLNSLRGNRPTYTNFRASDFEDIEDKYGHFPIFWSEVWDKDAKRFITIDPIVKKTIEVIRLKSQLEPPTSETRNNVYYVIGFDRLGGVRDITRRYAETYNAKVRKKRITRDPKGEEWYENVLLGATTVNRIRPNKIDKFEELEFEELSLKEGMPNSIQDFRNHPIYVLESQLKANEILKPKLSCGTIRKKSKTNKQGKLIPVYKRANVYTVRSAKAWYMRGRVLKLGERPMKIKNKPKVPRKARDEDDFELSDKDEEDDVRLYADFQTERFTPPQVMNGEIPRNAFGNIDVYQPWMVPEGCVHIMDDNAVNAARLMQIEYAPAAVGFNFDGDRRSHSVSATVKIQGIVTFKQYQEAVNVVCKGLEEFEAEKSRRRQDLIALRAWKILLAKLRIANRLNEEHGKVINMIEENYDEGGDEEEEEEEDDDGEEIVHTEDGGFMRADAQNVNEDIYYGRVDDEVGDVDASDFHEEQDDRLVVTEENEVGTPKIKADSPVIEVENDNNNEFEDFMNEVGFGDEHDREPENESDEAGGFVVENFPANQTSSEKEKVISEGSVTKSNSPEDFSSPERIPHDVNSTFVEGMIPPKHVDPISIRDHPAQAVSMDVGEKELGNTSIRADNHPKQPISSVVGGVDAPIEIPSDSDVINLDEEYADDEGYEFEYSD